MLNKKETELLNELEKRAFEQGFDLIDLERTGAGRNALLRVYIDKEGGLTLDDVAGANSWISEVVEQLDPYKGSYTLEVSSPGIDRPLRTFAHFEQAVGQEVVLTLKNEGAHKEGTDASAKPRLKYTGTLVSVDPEKQLLVVEADGLAHTLEFAQIKKARIKGQLDFDRKG